MKGNCTLLHSVDVGWGVLGWARGRVPQYCYFFVSQMESPADVILKVIGRCLCRWWRPFRCYGSTCWNWRRSMSSVKTSATVTSPASRPRCTATTSSGMTWEDPTLRPTPASTCSRSVRSLLWIPQLSKWRSDESFIWSYALSLRNRTDNCLYARSPASFCDSPRN